MFKQKKANSKIVGFVDKIEDNAVYGWAYDENSPYESIALDVYVDNEKYTTILANIFRQDLVDANIGNGKYGFECKLSNFNFLDTHTITVCQHAKKNKIIGTIESGFIGAINETAKILFTEQLSAFIAMYQSNSKKRTYKKRQKKEITSIDKKVFQQKKNSLDAYMEYVYYRYKLNNSFDLDRKQEFYSFINWYLMEYSKIRKNYTIPLSGNLTQILTEYVHINDAQFQLSQYHMFSLKSSPTIANLNNILNDHNTFINVIFDWSINQIGQNSLSDCLVPQSYIKELKKINTSLNFKKIPLSHFTTLYHAHNVKYHCLDLHKAEDRLVYYIMLILDAYVEKRADLLLYIPKEILDLIFKNDLISKLYKDIFNTNKDEYFDKESIKNAYLDYAFNLETQTFLTIDVNGNRSESAKYIGLHDNMPICDIQVIGPFEKASGLGQACRLSANAFEAAGFSVNRVDFDMDNPAPEGYNAQEKLSELANAKINLIHLNAESIPLVYAYLPNVFEKSYNIGYFYWELDSPARCHDLALELLDEVWVSTEYGVQQYQPYTSLPVVNVGMAYEELPQVSKEEAQNFLEEKYGIEKTKTVFLSTFDSFSFIQRKNPLGVLNAFQEAFPDEDDVVLLIKTHNKDKIADPVQLKIWEEIDAIIDADNRIVLVNETFQYKDLLKFKKGADCYITLHRSEGWGFGMIEAMNLEIPVIATGYSGNLEFTKEDNSWLVDYDEVYLEQDDYIFVKTGQKWAEPKIESAANALQEAYSNLSLREEKAKKAKQFIQKHFSIDRISERYRERINEILDNKVRNKI